MNKHKLIFVIPHLTIGGVQKSLISALKAIDYGKYDVTLYLRKNRTELLPFIDERANVIINKDPNRYYRKPFALVLQLRMMLAKLLGKKDKAKALNGILEEKIRHKAMEYERKTYFDGKHYDIAVAYVQGYVALFVDRCINADKKIVFYHTSTNENPELNGRIINNFTAIGALHSQQKALIEEWYPETKGKIRIVENYTDREMLLSQSKESTLPETDKTVICSCGRFAPVKGFDLAAKAAKMLKDKGIDFTWYFVGDGPERSKLDGLIAEYGLNDNIVITGMQKNPYPYMAACDIYIQPSYEEAMPVTVIEAHRLGKPIISTATVGGKKLVESGKNGVVCAISADAVAESIEKLINDKETYCNIVNNLKATDYSHEFEKYKEQWQALLDC